MSKQQSDKKKKVTRNRFSIKEKEMFISMGLSRNDYSMGTYQIDSIKNVRVKKIPAPNSSTIWGEDTIVHLSLVRQHPLQKGEGKKINAIPSHLHKLQFTLSYFMDLLDNGTVFAPCPKS